MHLGLAVAKGLQPDRRIRRVLIVGPGMDLAPRTGFREVPPESYQPWAVIDALVSTGFARLDDLEVTAADINPRVVAHLRRSATSPPTLSLTSEIAAKEGVSFSRDYRDYFAGLGAAAVEAGCGAARGRGCGRTSPEVRPGQRRCGQGSPRRAARHRHRAAHGAAVRPGDCHEHPSVFRRPAAGAGGVEHRRDAGSGRRVPSQRGPADPRGAHRGARAAVRAVAARRDRHVKGAPAPLFDSVFLHVRSR